MAFVSFVGSITFAWLVDSIASVLLHQLHLLLLPLPFVFRDRSQRRRGIDAPISQINASGAVALALMIRDYPDVMPAGALGAFSLYSLSSVIAVSSALSILSRVPSSRLVRRVISVSSCASFVFTYTRHFCFVIRVISDYSYWSSLILLLLVYTRLGLSFALLFVSRLNSATDYSSASPPLTGSGTATPTGSFSLTTPTGFSMASLGSAIGSATGFGVKTPLASAGVKPPLGSAGVKPPLASPLPSPSLKGELRFRLVWFS